MYYPYLLTSWTELFGKSAETVYPFRVYKIGKDEIDEMASKLVMAVRLTVQGDLERYLHNYEDGCFIYSAYKGYTALSKNTGSH